ncbi:short-subunit dehydrogenase [Roseibium hamelinense]|uniref:Short-subunit dehydrogenase n=1 Tax=Roseibium hamelinense TaxID=150831 RepID=A0A562T9Q0_9HYPH|nr:SDR family oxidoreductase [Roseibium hamelinense]MTI42097.1 SDR family oxidoreductase [Roseibium hamelinense]TWI89540.1 short-subunit dehydrogenase [Roseibium hamelinense]
MTRVLITATNRGIGLELARDALSRGWTVYGSARTPENAAKTQELLDNNRYRPLVFDVTDHKAVEAAAAGIEAPIDILINNAGIIGPDRQKTLDMDFGGFAQTLEINTLAPLAVSQIFLPHLKKSPRGRIVTMSSQMSWMGYQKSDRIAYRASKAAVNKVMQGLATDLKNEGIVAIPVDPGWVRTDMGGAEADNHPQDVARGILALADRLTLEDSGKFFNWAGEERAY